MIKTEMSTNAAYMILWGEIMMVRHFLDVEEVTSLKGANGVSKRTLLGKGESAPNFYLRRFRIEAGGNTPQHAHPWEHEIYVLSGSGTVMVEGEEAAMREGVAVLIPTGQEHQIRAGSETLEFICIIPAVEEY
ncbi:MAG TPA: cupin domain-containing protein [Deltaproteobacteria bacterium]|jgi:quercetin dioxygenase-like cupin family protein|nr:cupin domain-containing protein [Deltaproteobacteria bacterium]HOI05962.1 cupin domain-containing protein [Deltaproteobacteria bacterium]